ncbi:FtsX-like permease family protein [Phytohabitans sp. LJ34]|uniref:ABC transporter permease n=1 Tax=Phytohabitans sp. LJ34 TaxID=3452217 RepID=UPI003F8A2771
MNRIAFASLRHRAAASLATFVAVLLGTALLVTCGGLFETAIRLDSTAQRLAGAPVVVAGEQGFKLPDQEHERVAYPERSRVDGDLVAAVAAVPGVARAIPDISFPVGDSRLGHDWASAALTPYTIVDGREPRATGEVVVESGRLGERITILVSGTPREFTVTGIARAQRPVDAPAVFFSTADATRFAPRPGTVDAIGVLLTPGAEAGEVAARVDAALPPELVVLAGADRGAAEFAGVGASRLALILVAGIFSGMVVVVMALVVSATISLTVRQRRRELALLRAGGATPRQVHRMVVRETMAVAVLATACGAGAAWFVASRVFEASAARGVVPEALVFRLGPIPFAGAVLVSLVMARIASHLAALPAARTRPIQALAEAAIPPVTVAPIRRLLAGVFAAGTVALAVTTMFLGPEIALAIGGPAVLTGSIAVALVGPELIDRLVARLPRFGGLAAVNLRARAAQFAAVLTPLTVGVAIALGNVYAQTTYEAAASAGYTDQLRADAVITSTAGGIAPGLVDEVRGTPGVEAATPLVTSRGWLDEPYDGKGSDPSTILGVGPSALDVPVSEGTLDAFSGDVVALPEKRAEDLDIAVGDRVTMRFGDGARVPVTVVALLDSPSHYAGMVVPPELLAPHTTAGAPRQLLVQGRSSGLPEWPSTTVDGGGALRSSFEAGLDVQGWISYLVALLAIAYAAIAAVNTMAVAVLSRRGELAVQRLAGATRRQIRRMLLTEAAVLAAIAVGLGTAIAAFTVLPMAVALGTLIPRGPIWVYVAVVAAAFVIVGPATALAARIATRRRAIVESHT